MCSCAFKSVSAFTTSSINGHRQARSMPGFVNVSLLRSQQHQLAAMKACHQLFQHQRILRKVLKQPSTGIAISIDALNEGDDSESGSEQLLIQKLMIKATQPSPLKAIFTKEELEVFIHHPLHLLFTTVHACSALRFSFNVKFFFRRPR